MPHPCVANLDAAAGLPVLPEIAALYPEYCRRYGWNPHGVTLYAEEVRRALLLAERELLSLVGADASDTRVLWCASGTEAANVVLRGLALPAQNAPILLDGGAHPALFTTAHALLPPSSIHEFLLDETGRPKWLSDAPPLPTATHPALVALSHVNNESGVLWNGDHSAFPPGTPLLLDACQSFTKHPLPWKEAKVSFLILSARKIGGPSGVAALLVRKGERLRPLLTGGGQQGGLRAGTLDAVSILLFCEAAKRAAAQQREALENAERLNRRLREGLQTLGKGTWPIFSPEGASPYILYFGIPAKEGAILARMLAEKYGVLVGVGSACSAETHETSRLLRRQGVPDSLARGAIRLSLSQHTTAAEVQAFLDALPLALQEY